MVAERDARKRSQSTGTGSALASSRSGLVCFFGALYSARNLRLQPLPPEMKHEEANAEADGRLILQSTTALAPL